MSPLAEYSFSTSWSVILTDLGLNPAEVLKRARLRADLLRCERAWLSSEEYFRFWIALEEEDTDPSFP
jgi:hypothetical protein